MVCAECNGKGYVVIEQQESVCPECAGCGEYLLDRVLLSEKDLSFGDQPVAPDASCG